ncbi:MAG: hypothetical protein J6X55_09470 [Victivallales bacterium]|nr:hypothetical protein [Victivallales bacterium]
MKRQLIISFALLLLTGILLAGVKPGENILFNGAMHGNSNNPMTGEPSHAPDSWMPMSAIDGVRFITEGGVATGKGFVRFTPADPSQLGLEVTIKQAGIKLVTGEKYRISALVRTKDFESPHCGIVVYDRGWFHETGIQKFPKNQDWTRMSIDVSMISPNEGLHTFAIYACNFKGILDVTDVKLEALTEKGQQETVKSEMLDALGKPLLIPMEPLVNKITIPEKGQGADYPTLSFLFHGNLPDNTAREDYDIRYSVNDLPEDAIALHEGRNTIVFKKDVKPGDFKLAASVVNRRSGEVICRQEYTATFILPIKTSSKGHKRLNNLVVEILNQPIAKDIAQQSFNFCTMRDGWVFIAMQDAEAESLEVVLDGKLTVITAKTPRLETFRDISMGDHVLTINGAAKGGRLIVRSIPEIYNYKPCCDSMVPENPPYNWDFQNKYVHYAVTTHNDGVIPEEHRDEFFKAGYKWIGSIGTTNVTGDNLLKKLDTCRGMNSPYYQGVSCDEQFFGSLSSIVPFTDGMKRFVPKNDHIVYTWITGHPSISGIDNDFLSACVNSCRGRGRLISEVYCRSKPTLQEAQRYLQHELVDRTASFKKFFPLVMDHWGIIFGNFIQIPVISLAHHPNVDYKYYLDMQFNLIANHPECKDMAITGYWGTRHCDFELYRWCFMLTRHYCVEGKKTMLSDEYGFSYEPGHVVNGDFINGLDNWTVDGNVTTGRQSGYGQKSQCRWFSPRGTGDTFAVMTKKEDGRTSTLTQVAKGFVPGRMYCLQFAVADYNDLKNNKFNPRRVGIDVFLGDGAIVDKEQSWVHVDKRTKGQYAYNNNVPKCNLHHVVFKAVKPEITITIDNRQAADGEAAAINYVMLNPFLAP